MQPDDALPELIGDNTAVVNRTPQVPGSGQPSEASSGLSTTRGVSQLMLHCGESLAFLTQHSILWVSSVIGYALSGLKKIPQCHSGLLILHTTLPSAPGMTYGLDLLASAWCAP